jgi:Fe-S cluster assembly protein SufD
MTLVQDRPHSHGAGPTGSPADRFTSRNPDDFAVPRGREEDWRFTPVREIRDFFEPLAELAHFHRESSAPEPASIELVDRDHPAVGRVLRPGDRVSALAFAGAQRAVLVQIPADVVLTEPVRVTITGDGASVYGHLVIDAGKFSAATVIVKYAGKGRSAGNVEIIAGDGAQLTVVHVEDGDSDFVHLQAHAVSVGRDASVKHVVVCLGGALVRITPTVQFEGPGGSVELLGVSFAGADQHFESRLYIDHGVPNCRSNVLYKTALLGDSARTVWIGDVRIRPDATGTDTYEMNRNLLLSDGARADSVPNLEIETGNIAGAGHASATGRFDDLQLFYLQSRGIPEETARRLVVRGFFADVVNRIGLPDLQDQIMAAIEQRLGYAPDRDSENA